MSKQFVPESFYLWKPKWKMTQRWFIASSADSSATALLLIRSFSFQLLLHSLRWPSKVKRWKLLHFLLFVLEEWRCTKCSLRAQNVQIHPVDHTHTHTHCTLWIYSMLEDPRFISLSAPQLGLWCCHLFSANNLFTCWLSTVGSAHPHICYQALTRKGCCYLLPLRWQIQFRAPRWCYAKKHWSIHCSDKLYT